MELITPPHLKRGDTIGIFAPARKVLPTQMDAFKSMVEREGYKIIEAPHLYGSNYQHSGSVEQRKSDLQQLLNDPNVRAIFAARGGYGAAQLLNGLTPNIITNDPKWLVGFSDVTALHAVFGKYLESIHGVMPYSLSMDPPQGDNSFKMLFEFLRGAPLNYSITPHPMNYHGSVTAPVVGGNLSVLYSLAGTSFEPEYDGRILFLEDLDEYLYHIDRMLLNFEQRGIFERIAGLLIGSFSDIHDNEIPFGKSTYDNIAEKAHKYKVPTLFNFPAGHKIDNFPLIFGRLSTLIVEEHSCVLKIN